MSWTEQRIGDHFRVKHGYAFKGQYFSEEGDFVVVTPGNFFEAGGFRDRGDKNRRYTAAPDPEYVLGAGDLIIAMTEQAEGLLGSSALVPVGDLYLHNQRMGLVVDLDEERLSKRFLYYLLNTRPVRAQIRATATGTKVKHTAPKRIQAVVAQLPEVPVQERIADILTAYEDLIQNNNRRMALLEEAIHLLYREWFVHLRFPGHERVEVADGVPEGWERRAIADLAEFRNGFAFKPKHLGDAGKAIVKIPELRNGVTEKTPRNPGGEVPEKHHFDDGTLLFSWSGSFVVRVWNDGPALLNQHLFQVIPSARCGVAFLEAALAEAIDRFRARSVGTTMKHIRRSALRQVEVLVPPESVLGSFTEIAETFRRQRDALEQSNRRLNEARDLLLPRLMNGSIPV